MYNTEFYYDWNTEYHNGAQKFGWIWPGLLFTEKEEGANGYDMYIRGDVEDDNSVQIDSDYDFNDLIGGLRETYLTGNKLSLQANPSNVMLVQINTNSDKASDEDLSIDPVDNMLTIDIVNDKSVELKNNIFFYHNGNLLVGMTADKIKMEKKYACSQYLAWDDSKKQLYFNTGDGKRYLVYVASDLNTPINNIAAWGSNDYLYRFQGQSSTNKKCTVGTFVWKTEEVREPAVDPKTGEYVYDENTGEQVLQDPKTVYHYVKRNTDDIVAIHTEMPVVEVLNMYTPDKSSNSASQIDYARSYNALSTVYVWTKNLIKPHSSKDNITAKEARNNALKDLSIPWRTPTEFYSAQNNGATDSIPSGNRSFIKSVIDKEDANAKKTVPIWWWSNSLQNWCTFKKIKKHTIALYVWDGHDTWQRFSMMVKNPVFNKVVIEKYFYDVREFSRGPSINARINYDRMFYNYKSIKMPRDTKFSHYESNTFQTLKISKAHVDDKGTSRYPVSCGIPPIMRLPSGEITCLYELRIPGMSKNNEVIWPENVDFLNSTCKAFFGGGDEKTIKDDWKVFDKINDASEEIASDIFNKDDPSLIDADPINTTKEDKEVMLLNMAMPRQYPEGKTISGESYVERWDR